MLKNLATPSIRWYFRLQCYSYSAMAAVAATPTPPPSSALYAESRKGSEDKFDQRRILYNNLHSLINGMYTGSLKCVAKFYPDIVRWLRDVKVEVVDDDTEPVKQTADGVVQISDVQLSMLISAGSKEHGSPHVSARKKFLKELLAELRKHKPGSVRFRIAERNFFKEAFLSLEVTEWKDLESCKVVSELCDFLLNQLVISSREGFVDAGVEYFLQRSMFEQAFRFWRTQARVYHTKFGLQSLLDYVISRYTEHEGVCKDRIVEIMRESCSLVKPTEYIACVVTAMLVNGYINDAKAFMKLFSIPGLDFMYSLRKVAEKELRILENFGELLSEVYFMEAKMKKRKQKAPRRDSDSAVESSSSDVEAEPVTVSSMCEFRFLLNIWKQPAGGKKLKKFMKKREKPRMHQVDIRQLEDLAQRFISTWISAAGFKNDCDSLIRLHKFITTNQLHVQPRTAVRCRSIFRRNNRITDCPFNEPPDKRH